MCVRARACSLTRWSIAALAQWVPCRLLCKAQSCGWLGKEAGFLGNRSHQSQPASDTEWPQWGDLVMSPAWESAECDSGYNVESQVGASTWNGSVFVPDVFDSIKPPPPVSPQQFKFWLRWRRSKSAFLFNEPFFPPYICTFSFQASFSMVGIGLPLPRWWGLKPCHSVKTSTLTIRRDRNWMRFCSSIKWNR